MINRTKNIAGSETGASGSREIKYPAGLVGAIVGHINRLYPHDSDPGHPYEINVTKQGEEGSYILSIVKTGNTITLAEKHPNDAAASRNFSFLKVEDTWQYESNGTSNTMVSSIPIADESKIAIEVEGLQRLSDILQVL